MGAYSLTWGGATERDGPSDGGVRTNLVRGTRFRKEKKRVRTETVDGPGTPWGGATIPDKKLCARLAKVPTTRKNVFEDANLGVVVETACRQIPDDIHQFDLTD